MSPAPEQDRGAIAFGEKLITVLAEGNFNTTYKYAVLLGLMDLCLEHSTGSGGAPRELATRQLAEKVVAIYWPHVLPFRPSIRADPLAQGKTGQAEIIQLITRFRQDRAPDASASLARARAHDPRRFERLVRDVEWKLAEMPLPRLQRVGHQDTRFIYRIGWEQGLRRREFRQEDFDRSIRFVGDAGDHLVRLSGLLRPLIHREWTRFVAQVNADLVEESRLEDFLFGVPRVPLGPIRDDLREIEGGRCFYCERPLTTGWEIDHFIPWARYPNNGVENLVAADSSCNGRKLDHLAAAEHVEHWLERQAKRRSDLDSISQARAWERHPDRSISVARSIYLRLPSDAQLWRMGREFVGAERRRLVEAFS